MILKVNGSGSAEMFLFVKCTVLFWVTHCNFQEKKNMNSAFILPPLRYPVGEKKQPLSWRRTFRVPYGTS